MGTGRSRSNPVLWQPADDDPFRTETTRSETCGLLLVLRHRDNGEPARVARDCWSYGCPACGPKRIDLLYDRALEYFRREAHLFVAKVPIGPVTRKRVNKRMSRAHRASISIERASGIVWVFADGDFSGRDQWKVHSLGPAAAAKMLVPALRFPGLVKVRASKRWPMPNEEPAQGTGKWQYLDTVTSATDSRAIVRAREIYSANGGASWPEDAIWPSDWRGLRRSELYAEALRQVRGVLRSESSSLPEDLRSPFPESNAKSTSANGDALGKRQSGNGDVSSSALSGSGDSGPFPDEP